MPRKKCLCEVDKVGNNAVIRVRPERRKFKAVACLSLFAAARVGFLNGIMARSVGVIFRVRAVGNNEYLNIVIQSAARPERFALITFYLIERLFNGNAAPLKVDMDHWRSVYKHGHVVAVVVPCAAVPVDRVLIDDL